MKNFKSWKAYREFEKKVIEDQRHIFDSEINYFFKVVITTAKEREKNIRSGSVLWRAQLGNSLRPLRNEEGKYIIDIPTSFGPKRMIPQQGKASEGRSNPKGIPYLYLSTSKETAMAEVRPWIGSLISLSQIKILNDLTLIDCSKNHREKFIFSKVVIDPKDTNDVVWSHIDTAFSKPVERNDFSADYAPTQILSELFKNKGYNGIIYNSYLGNGLNIALFDIESAKVLNSRLYKTEDIDYEFIPSDNTTFFKSKEK